MISLRVTGRNLDRLGTKAGQFFFWRFFTQGLLVHAAPVLAVGGAARRLVPDHGQEPRRPQREVRPDPGRDARLRRGAVRRLHRREPHARQDAPDRRRDRHHAGARAARGDGRRPRRALPRRLRRRPRLLRRARPHRGGARREGELRRRRPRERRGPRPAVAERTSASSSRTSPSATSSSAGRSAMIDSIVPNLRHANVPRGSPARRAVRPVSFGCCAPQVPRSFVPAPPCSSCWAGNAFALVRTAKAPTTIKKKVVSNVTRHGPVRQVPPVGLHAGAAEGVEDRGHERPAASRRCRSRSPPSTGRSTPITRRSRSTSTRRRCRSSSRRRCSCRPPPGSKLENISGATHTTVSWRESLQAALAKA